MIELLKFGRDLVVAVDHPVRVGLELLGVRRLVPVRRHPLGEQRHDVYPSGTSVLSKAVDNTVAEQPHREPFRASGRPARCTASSRRHLDRTHVVFPAGSCRGTAVKSGRSASAQVDLDDAAARLSSARCRSRSRRAGSPGPRDPERGARVRGARPRPCAVSCCADSPAHASSTAIAQQDQADPARRSDLAAVLSTRGVLDRVGDRAHAALLRAPVPQVPSAHVTDASRTAQSRKPCPARTDRPRSR